MSILDAPIDTKLKILEINSGNEFKRKLFSLGMQIDDCFIKIHPAKRGPILLQSVTNPNSKLALDRKLAESIIVAYE